MNTVKVENCKTLFIGRRGENEVTEVVFDFSEWQTEFGNGVIDLFVKRNGDSAAYPVVLSVDGTVATWIVTDADTAVVGSGKIEFVYTVDQKVAKSAIFPFYVGEDIGQASSEPPDPYESWIETLTELGTETQANAQAAAQSASDAADSAASASESAGQAEDSAEDAEAWAVGERNGEPVSVGDETYENNAKYWAEKAKTDAPVTSVNGKAGDIELNLDDIPDGETYARATPEQLAQIGENADDIADIDAMIPNTTSESNPLVNVSFLTNRLTSYRTSAAQDTIDSGKQEKITAFGILKRDRSGNIAGAIAGTDYLTADALNGYRKATAQDAIDNAQNTEIGKNTAALDTMQPAATAADIGKALIVKTVADGKPTSYEYGEAGGGGSTLTAGDGIDITEDVISNTQGIEYIVGTQAASTASWKGNSTDETLKVGKIIAYYLPFAGSSSSNATLTLTMGNGAQTAAIPLRRTGTSAVTNQFAAGNVIILIYDGTYWRVSAYYDQNDNTVPTGYCLSPAATAAKAATCSYGYRGDTNYFPCLFRYANTATDATLAITTYAPEAAPIYVNGERTSASNTFSAGVILFLYYNGAYYCYNDGRFPILVDGTVTSVQEYAAGLLVNYRTSAAQDVIDAGKQAKITATGILKGDGAGGVSSAVAGTDYITGLEILSYGNSTWDDFLAAYTANKVVYCRASSNSNPASGSQTRMAFMAYVNDAANPTNVEFQYYRSVQTHSDSQQGDQVFVYKLDKTGGWTVTTRNTFTAIDAGTGLSKAYANGKLTLSVDGYRTAADQDVIDNEQDDRLDAVEQTTTATTIGPAALATFEASAANMPLKRLTVNIDPVQNLNGYDKPWPGGGGKNLLDGSKTYQSSNTIIRIGADDDSYSLQFPAGQYTFSCSFLNDVHYGVFMQYEGGSNTALITSSSTTDTVTFTLGNTPFRMWFYGSGGASIDNVTNIQLEQGTSATNYEPYSNICPITGWTGCNVVHGALPSSVTWTEEKAVTPFGSIVSAPGAAYSSLIPVESGTNAFILLVTEPAARAMRVSGYNASGNHVRQLTEKFIGASDPVGVYYLPFTADDSIKSVRLTVGQFSKGTPVMLGANYNIAFPSPDPGTVYGGTLDVVNKKLTVTHQAVVFNGSESGWAGFTQGSVGNRVQWNTYNTIGVPNADFLSDKFVAQRADDVHTVYSVYGSAAAPRMFFSIPTTITSLQDWKDWLTENNVTVVYPIATPIVYDLTADEITTLLGTNNIWADTGDVTVTYGAYLETVKAYADKVGDSILSAIAPLETTYIAGRAYTVGSFLFVGTKFYKVTAAIASGDTITPDTNVTQTTIAEQLMALANV